MKRRFNISVPVTIIFDVFAESDEDAFNLAGEILKDVTPRREQFNSNVNWDLSFWIDKFKQEDIETSFEPDEPEHDWRL